MSGPLGSLLAIHPDRDEYQVGRTLVYVLHSPWASCAWSDEVFGRIWAAIPEVVALAEGRARARLPEFGRARDASPCEEAMMAVLSITIDPADGSAEYDVGGNWDLLGADATLDAAWDDNFTVDVRRDPAGELTLLD